MFIRISALVLALSLTWGAANATSFNRTGYKMGAAVEFLVTRDRNAVDISKKTEAEILAFYAIAFGNKLSGKWPENLPEGFGKRSWNKMILIMGTNQARDSGLAFVVGPAVDDANVFASRYDRNSDEAKRLIEAVVLLVGNQ